MILPIGTTLLLEAAWAHPVFAKHPHYEQLESSTRICSHTPKKISENIDKTCLIARIKNVIKWALSRMKEIPFLLCHPTILRDKYYRWKVRQVVKAEIPQKITIAVSRILPCHPLEGNGPAQSKNEERVLLLKKHKDKFDQVLSNVNPIITQELIEEIMDSTSSIQLAYDAKENKCITLDGNSRLIALKHFIQESYQGLDPLIQINAYEIDPNLLKPITPERDFSFPTQ